jgi:hypothetical protein
MVPVGAAHVYGHVLLSAPATHDRADHASPVGDRVAIGYLYLDAYARLFGIHGASPSFLQQGALGAKESKARGLELFLHFPTSTYVVPQHVAKNTTGAILLIRFGVRRAT